MSEIDPYDGTSYDSEIAGDKVTLRPVYRYVPTHYVSVGMDDQTDTTPNSNCTAIARMEGNA